MRGVSSASHSPTQLPLLPIVPTMQQAESANAELGYRLTVPDGFVPFPEGKASNADLVDCWTEATPVSQTGALVFCVQRMHGVLPREAIKAGELPPQAVVTLFKWKGFDLQGIRTGALQDHQRVFTLVTQVPLRKEAIHLMYAGPSDQEARAKKLMQSTLGSLEGDSNWLTSTQRAERLGNAAGAWIGIGIALVVAWQIRKRRAAAA